MGVGEEQIGGLDALHRVELRGGSGVVMIGQALDLLDIEHGVPLHEENVAVGFLAVLAGFAFGDAVGVDDQRTLGPFLDMGTEFLGLVEGQPDRGGKALGDGGGPQHQHVDALVGLALEAKRAGDAPGGVFGVPWLEPGADAFFQFGDDGVGDAGVNVGAFGLHGNCLLR